MKLLDFLHRWIGGVVGLLLGLMGLSGAILVHRDALIFLPHAGDARVADVGLLGEATARLMAAKPQSIVFASDSFGLDRLVLGHGAGAYADQSGAIVTRWSSQWARPELWIFDFHHHLFAADNGEWVLGFAGLCGLFFLVSGVILWWRTRKTFALRALPKRLSRPAIVRHHRDLGIVVAPLLLMVLYTGTAMLFRPVSSLVLGPGAPAAIKAANKPPKAPKVALGQLDWPAIVRTAHDTFPDAQLRMIALPREKSGIVTVRMRRPAEWLPNGRTMVWFAADSGRLIGSRDAYATSAQAIGFGYFYPLHAAKVGGLVYRLVMTLVGLALMLLGSLAIWSFWFRGGRAQAGA